MEELAMRKAAPREAPLKKERFFNIEFLNHGDTKARRDTEENHKIIRLMPFFISGV
jgi:hypothetical protein